VLVPAIATGLAVAIARRVLLWQQPRQSKNSTNRPISYDRKNVSYKITIS